ncbi:phosphoribosyl-AMP cyclohydrolase [Hahella sp. CCB-MM4]|uniref:phosphoribosyl-AMP cyclohydrolase n=1 Tax=Hahella sp. (strain CCB-MM4) TaxID=1926491 RepID=UPI000B9AE50B|nr:phosphoribosyl-AMP cyclohydrolase [Hahella sp. CCB-MM4]OZG74898.1 phosphoribosyl-AMP cyclohydrolase [Hahella sp. CCB-MM4]
MKNAPLWDEIKWNEDGLIPAIAQDAETGTVLMMAWMNADSLQETIERREAVYWSRSRQKLWHKGEASGHVQKIHDILLDCDGDTLLLKVNQIGGIACHTGRNNCFFRSLEGDDWKVNADVLKSPKDIYGK